MRKSNFLVAIAVILFIAVIVSVAVSFYVEWKRETDDSSGAESTEKPETQPPTDSTTGTTTPAPVPSDEFDYVTDVNEESLLVGTDQTYLMLVNRTHPLDADYEPARTTFLLKRDGLTTKDEELEARTAEALLQMMREMRACGITDTLVTSAYRSYARQSELFSKYIQTEIESVGGFSADAYACLGYLYLQENYISKGIKQLSYEDAKRVAMTYSAEPGQSEHQSGLCVDFITEDMNGHLTTVFEDKEAFAWLSENAHKFGFILRFPKGKESITGYTYEPWHYRFVGREAATEIYKNGLTLEEYLGENE